MTMKQLLAGLAALLVLPSAAAAAGSTPPVPDSWQSAINAAHPLVGRLVRVRDGARVAPETLAGAASEATYVLLGETHDNPDHHALQAWIVRAMTARGRRPAVAFEMIDADQGRDLRRYLDGAPGDAGGLGDAVGWRARGWPAWEIYRPIGEAALAHDLPMWPADVARKLQKQVGRHGFDGAVDAERRARLALDRPLGNTLRSNLMAELKAGHCNMLPESALAPMARVQRLRDAVMADNLMAAAKDSADGAVLIAGRGHARADRGVPWYLRARLDAPSVLTVGIVEAMAGQTEWRSYLPQAPEAGPAPFDYIWITPRFDDTDHCAEMRKRMEKMRQSHGAGNDGN